MAIASPVRESSTAPARAAAIAGHLLRLVESGYFERRPHADEQTTATWLTQAIAEVDGLQTVFEHEAIESTRPP